MAKYCMTILVALFVAACGEGPPNQEISDAVKLLRQTACARINRTMDECNMIVECAIAFPEKATGACMIPVVARRLLGGPEPTRDEIQAVLNRAMAIDKARQ